ncbi:MAG: cytosine permease [Oscillospiraceae bacterium]|nr:cytosine permease [Oscillospiraceae bacterium]
MSKEPQTTSVDYELTAVPKESRKSFLSMFVIMMGFTFFSASMSVGGQLGVGMNLSGFVWAMILGNAILGAYTGFLAYIGCHTGLTLDLMARRSFGIKGSWLPSFLISFTQMGWFGVGLAMFSIPVAELTGLPVWVLIILAGVLMTSSAYFGIKSLEIVSLIAVPLIAVLGCVSVGLGVGTAGGIGGVFAQNPAEPLTFATALTLVVGSFVSGGTTTPNYTRFSKTNKIAVISTVIAFFIGNSLMFIFGAVGGAVTGQADIFYIMIAQGLAIPAIIILGLNIWTTADNGLYSCGLGLSNITGFKKQPMVLVSGLIGTVASVWLYYNFCSWLTFLGSAIPPVGGVAIIDYFMHKSRYFDKDESGLKTVNWVAVVAVFVGAAIGLYAPGISSLNSIISACVIFYVGDKFLMKK